MKVKVKLFASLQENRFIEKFHTCTEKTTVQILSDDLSLPSDDIAIIFINNVHASKADLLHDGDEVAFFPPVGGG